MPSPGRRAMQVAVMFQFHQCPQPDDPINFRFAFLMGRPSTDWSDVNVDPLMPGWRVRLCVGGDLLDGRVIGSVVCVAYGVMLVKRIQRRQAQL